MGARSLALIILTGSASPKECVGSGSLPQSGSSPCISKPLARLNPSLAPTSLAQRIHFPELRVFQNPWDWHSPWLGLSWPLYSFLDCDPENYLLIQIKILCLTLSVDLGFIGLWRRHWNKRHIHPSLMRSLSERPPGCILPTRFRLLPVRRMTSKEESGTTVLSQRNTQRSFYLMAFWITSYHISWQTIYYFKVM